MINKMISLIICSMILFQSCSSQKLSKSIEGAIGEKLYAKFTGRVFVKESSDNSSLLLINTNKSSENYDKAIVVFSDVKQSLPPIDETATYEFFIPENRRYIVIYNQKTEKISLAALTDKAAKELVDHFKSSPGIKDVLTKDILGYGLSYMSNTLWSSERIKESRYQSPFNTLDYANMTNPAASAALVPPDEENTGSVSCAQGVCSSGGAGSGSCSITEAPLNQSCTVTCNSGYYACCVSSTVRCYCCKVQ